MIYVYIDNTSGVPTPTTKFYTAPQASPEAWSTFTAAFNDADIDAAAIADGGEVIFVPLGGRVLLPNVNFGSKSWGGTALEGPVSPNGFDPSLPYFSPDPAGTDLVSIASCTGASKNFRRSCQMTFDGGNFRAGVVYDIFFQSDNGNFRLANDYLQIPSSITTPTAFRLNFIFGTGATGLAVNSQVESKSPVTDGEVYKANNNTFNVFNCTADTGLDREFRGCYVRNSVSLSGSIPFSDNVTGSSNNLSGINVSEAYADTANGDYTLLTVNSNPLLDVGVDVSAENGGVTVDAIGNPRGQGANWDVGRLEITGIRGIDSVDGDDQVLPGQTGVQITATGLDTNPTTQAVNLVQGSNSISATIESWNSGQPIITVPNSNQLLQGAIVSLQVTDDQGTISRDVTLSLPSQYGRVVWNGNAPAPGGQSLQTEAINDSELSGGFTAQSGDVFEFETLPNLNVSNDTTAVVSNGQNVGPLQYRIWSTVLESYTQYSSFSILGGQVTTAPTVTLSQVVGTQTGAFTVTATISQSVTDATPVLTLSAGTASAISGSGTTRQWAITPPANQSGIMTIQVAAGSFVNGSELSNASNTISIAYDTVVSNPDTTGPVITLPSVIAFTFPNGGAGLSHADSTFAAAIASASATDETAPANPVVTNNLGTLPNPLTAGIHTIRFLATDSANNTTTSDWVITVAEASGGDTEAPVITMTYLGNPVNDGDTIRVLQTGSFDMPTASAVDNVQGNLPVLFVPAVINTNAVSTIPVEASATDGTNTARINFNVEVIEAPSFGSWPSTINLNPGDSIDMSQYVTHPESLSYELQNPITGMSITSAGVLTNNSNTAQQLDNIRVVTSLANNLAS